MYGAHVVRFALPGLLVLVLTACAHRNAETPAAVPGPLEAAEVVTPDPAPAQSAPPSTIELTSSAAADLELPPPPGTGQAALYSKRLNFHDGDPIIPVRLMEGRREVMFSPRGPMRLKVSGRIEKTVQAPAGSLWRARVTQGEQAKLAARVQIAEFRFADREGLAAAQRQWEARGLALEVHTLGSIYGIAGKVIDNRSNLLLLDARFTPAQASAKQNELLRNYGARTSIFEQLQTPSSGIVELLDASGAVVAVGQDRLDAETLDGAPIEVRQVEYGVGYDFHNFEDRTFRGAIRFTVDRQGLLAVVNLVKIEDLLKGLVPSEIFARAHEEALKAQAVTARGEVLAKVGTRHLADPYLLCSEQHCAVYKGLSGEVASTNAAVEDTHGEALFSKDGRLVDSVYSAVCGGHSEDNDVVWGGVPNPSLRGKPDLILPRGVEPTPKNLRRFLNEDVPAACRLSSFAQASRFRWERRFTAAEVDALTADLGIGPIMAMSVPERGVSGRARVLHLSGEKGATQIRGELNIRRRFKMLNSAMFEVFTEQGPDGAIASWVFKGGGWGHGVGLCQTGAIGRAEHGQDYREILRHYFNGAEVSAIY